MKDPAAAKAKIEQGHDADPPRCATCVYFRREPHTMFRLVEKKRRNGNGTKIIKVPAPKHPLLNPIIERCSYGNFQVKPHHLCDRWHSRQGERLEDANAD